MSSGSDLPLAAPHARSAEEVLSALQAAGSGLGADEARRRLAIHGPNALPVAAGRHPLLRFLAQFNNALIYFLLAAALAAWLLGHLIDASVILAVVLVNAEVLRLDQETTLKLKDVPLDAAQPTLLDLAFGAVQSFSRAPRKVNVNTSYMTLAIRGTEFVIRADREQSRLTVLEGEVVASNALGELPVPGGQSAVAGAGQAPRLDLVVRPRDAVQWSLFYPPLFTAPPGDPPALQDARRLAAVGDVAGAVAAVDKLAPADRTPAVLTYRAALLLQVGRAQEARADLDAALAADPGAADALALRAVIHDGAAARDAAELLRS